MDTIYLKKGKNIKLKGAPARKVVRGGFPNKVAIIPTDFRGIKPKLLVKVDDDVKVGTPLIHDRNNTKIQIVSPASGKIAAINRSEKRALLEIVVITDGKQDSIGFTRYDKTSITKLKRDEIIQRLLESGLWALIRQRPFSKIANPQDTPKSIFVQAMNTEPLSLDPDIILNGQNDLFQAGLDIISHLAAGNIHLCFDKNASSTALTQAKNVNKHTFSGPHPTGNVSTHIHYIDPIAKGDTVWYIHSLDILKIANLFLYGKYIPQHFVALAGEGISDPVLMETIPGASIQDILSEKLKDGNYRYISGSVLSGKNVGRDGFLCFYDTQVSVIPEGGRREILGWLLPGLKKYSFSKTCLSSFLPEKEVSLDTDENGGHRAIVWNHIYDSLNTLDILTYFLIKAIISENIDEAEQLGILECDEEDFSLCTFACPSKTDVGDIIRKGLDLIEKEG